MAGKVGFEIISKLDSYFVMTVAQGAAQLWAIKVSGLKKIEDFQLKIQM